MDGQAYAVQSTVVGPKRSWQERAREAGAVAYSLWLRGSRNEHMPVFGADALDYAFDEYCRGLADAVQWPSLELRRLLRPAFVDGFAEREADSAYEVER